MLSTKALMGCIEAIVGLYISSYTLVIVGMWKRNELKIYAWILVVIGCLCGLAAILIAWYTGERLAILECFNRIHNEVI